MEITTDLSGAAAATGARLLDLVDPGWAERVDLAIVNLRYTDRCILGQLFPGPDWPANCAELERRVDGLDLERRRAAAELQLSPGRRVMRFEDQSVSFDPIAAGFDVYDFDGSTGLTNYPALGRAWRAEIAARTRRGEA